MAYTTYTQSLRETGAGWTETLLAKLRARRENYLRYRQTADELHALNDRELADIGISRYDIPRIARESIYGA